MAVGGVDHDDIDLGGDDDVRRLLKLIVPAATGAGAAQINLAISTALAGGLLSAGSISAICHPRRG